MRKLKKNDYLDLMCISALKFEKVFVSDYIIARKPSCTLSLIQAGQVLVLCVGSHGLFFMKFQCGNNICEAVIRAIGSCGKYKMRRPQGNISYCM